MPGSDENAVEQHEWVYQEWLDETGVLEFENFCSKCYRVIDYDKPIDEQFYSDCPEYEGDNNGDSEEDSDSE